MPSGYTQPDKDHAHHARPKANVPTMNILPATVQLDEGHATGE
jgi:hypothetical protein